MTMRNVEFNPQIAKYIGDQLGVNWAFISVDEFAKGMNMELEHGKKHAPTNISNDDPLTTGKIAWAHLMEIPDYYSRLEKMKETAQQFWKMKLPYPESLN